jgi:transcriptional regulator with XRE-family HTH domain
MIKAKISAYLERLMQELGETQEGLAKLLGTTKSSLQGYIKGENLPNIDFLIKMVELGGTTLDDLVKKTQPKIQIEIKGSHGVIIAGRDAYMDTTIRRITHYRPDPNDITGEEANELKLLVNDIVEIEKKTKKKPKTYGAVWNSLNKRMGVTYYREIKREQFEGAKLYLMQWRGRIKRSLKRTDEDEWRNKTQSGIWAAARNQLGWSKESVDNVIKERYGKESIRFLTKKELQQLYNIIFGLKKVKLSKSDQNVD